LSTRGLKPKKREKDACGVLPKNVAHAEGWVRKGVDELGFEAVDIRNQN